METQVMVERARLLHSQARIVEAISELKQVLAIEPRNGEALSLYARCLLDKGEYDEGLKMLDSAISVDPYNSYFFYLKGFAFYRKNENTQAIRWLKESISIEPYRSPAYGLLAIVHIEEKDFREGLKKADEGLAVDASDVICLNARSMALNKLRQTDAAIATMKEALAQDPDNEFTHTTFGWNLLEKGRHKEARVHFREALRIDPGYANAQSGLKESLKSQIPPYRWLLQYGFWISNKGKKAGWVIPLLIWVVVRIIHTSFSSNESTSIIGAFIVGIYLVFVVATWIINPVANFFLLFHKDGKYALNATEKWTAITVVSSLLAGLCFLLAGWLSPSSTDEIPPLYMIAFSFLLMAVPLGDVRYPLAWRGNGTSNAIAMVLVSLALLTVFTALPFPSFALVTGSTFLILFVLNNWFGLFKAIRRR